MCRRQSLFLRDTSAKPKRTSGTCQIGSGEVDEMLPLHEEGAPVTDDQPTNYFAESD